MNKFQEIHFAKALDVKLPVFILIYRRLCALAVERKETPLVSGKSVHSKNWTCIDTNNPCLGQKTSCICHFFSYRSESVLNLHTYMHCIEQGGAHCTLFPNLNYLLFARRDVYVTKS